jgi:5-methylcytosine-specific restriction endonuclease McrA
MATLICATRGCGRKTATRHCPEHAQSDNARRNAHPRRKIYDDRRWRATRNIVLHRDEFTCADCGLYSPTGRHLVADHIDGVLNCPNPFDPDECQTLCLTCSGSKDGARPSASR